MKRGRRDRHGTTGDRVLCRIKYHVKNLGSFNETVWSRARGHLLRWYGPRAVEALNEACAHRLPRVRWRAVSLLADIHDHRAYETILRLTKDPDPAVRYDAAWALGTLGDPRAVRPLIRLMNTRDPVNCVDSAAAQGLADLGRPSVPALIRNLSRGNLHARGMAAYVLGGIADKSSIKPLTRLLAEKNEWLRIAGIESLAEIEEELGHACCQRWIEKCLDDPVQQVRETASYWLKELRQ